MQRTTLKRALGLGTAIALIGFGGAYAVASANASPAEDIGGDHDAVPTGEPSPQGPAALPDQASDRASQAIAERGRDAHAQGPKATETTEAAPADEATDEADEDTDESGDDAGEDAGEGAGPGYGPGVHAGPHGDYGPDVHPDADSHPSGDDHPDADNLPDTTNHPGGPS